MMLSLTKAIKSNFLELRFNKQTSLSKLLKTFTNHKNTLKKVAKV